MALVFRADFAETLGKPTRTPEGFLRVDAYLTRAGVFSYTDAAGRVRREYRPPGEVFSESAIASFAEKPVTNEHPPEMITATNAAQYQRGHIVGDTLRRDGDRLRGELFITDAALIADMESGKRQLSGGYYCEVVEAAGVSPEGERYDAIQRGYGGNHAAVVPRGRAGDGCAARMDGAAFMSADDRAQEKAMLKVSIGGITYEVAEDVGAALSAERNDAAGALTAKTAEADTLRGEIEKLRSERTDSAAAIPALVRARVALEVTARQHLGAEAKIDALTDREVRCAVIEKLSGKAPGAELDERYIAARFDTLVEFAGANAASMASARVAATGTRTDGTGAQRTAEQARAEMVERNRNGWKASA